MHQKHPKIKRPVRGDFGKTEFAFVGSTCALMERLMFRLRDRLDNEFRTAVITGDHGEVDHQLAYQVGEKQLFSSQGSWNEYDDKLIGAAYDLLLVNGNHYPAARQIVFIDHRKAGSLQRRKEQLTDIALIIYCPEHDEVSHWLQELLASRETQDRNVPDIIRVEDAYDRLVDLIGQTAAEKKPPLKALILAGGKSARMGENKAELVYRNQQTEAERMAAACNELGLETFFSLRENAAEYYDLPVVPDRFLGLGPMGAIASAFLHDPEAAWLVVACDLPLLEKSHLQELIAHRDSRQFATAIQGSSQRFPEPLIAIYEPRAYARLLQFLTLGYACPRKLLINSDIATLKFEDEKPLTNANTPEERANVMQQLQGNG